MSVCRATALSRLHGYDLSWKFRRAKLATLVEICSNFQKRVSIYCTLRNVVFRDRAKFWFRSQSCNKHLFKAASFAQWHIYTGQALHFLRNEIVNKQLRERYLIWVPFSFYCTIIFFCYEIECSKSTERNIFLSIFKIANFFILSTIMIKIYNFLVYIYMYNSKNFAMIEKWNSSNFEFWKTVFFFF